MGADMILSEKFIEDTLKFREFTPIERTLYTINNGFSNRVRIMTHWYGHVYEGEIHNVSFQTVDLKCKGIINSIDNEIWRSIHESEEGTFSIVSFPLEHIREITLYSSKEKSLNTDPDIKKRDMEAMKEAIENMPEASKAYMLEMHEKTRKFQESENAKKNR